MMMNMVTFIFTNFGVLAPLRALRAVSRVLEPEKIFSITKKNNFNKIKLNKKKFFFINLLRMERNLKGSGSKG